MVDLITVIETLTHDIDAMHKHLAPAMSELRAQFEALEPEQRSLAADMLLPALGGLIDSLERVSEPLRETEALMLDIPITKGSN